MSRIRYYLLGIAVLLLVFFLGLITSQKIAEKTDPPELTLAEAVSFMVPEGWGQYPEGSLRFDREAYAASCKLAGPDWTPKGASEIYSFESFPGSEEMEESSFINAYSARNYAQPDDPTCAAFVTEWNQSVTDIKQIYEDRKLVKESATLPSILAVSAKNISIRRYIESSDGQTRGVTELANEVGNGRDGMVPVYSFYLYNQRFDQVINGLFYLKPTSEILAYQEKIAAEGYEAVVLQYLAPYFEQVMKDYPKNVPAEFNPIQDIDTVIKSITVS